MTQILKDLFDGDTEALSLRDKFRNQLSVFERNNKFQIIFPAIHISEGDDVLRYGMPRLYNGFVLSTPYHNTLIDPGVEFSYRWIKSGFDIGSIDSMRVTHQHIDHVGGAGVFLEWMLRSRKMIDIYLTKPTIKDSCIPAYYLGNSPDRANHDIHILEDNQDYTIGGDIYHSFSHFHGIECYGWYTYINNKKITHISDTGYAIQVQDNEGIKIVGKDKVIDRPVILSKHDILQKIATDSDILIINMEVFNYGKNSKTHICAWDIIDIVKNNNIKQLIISHINPCGQYTLKWIQKLQNFIESETGVKTIIPNRDGLVLEF